MDLGKIEAKHFRWYAALTQDGSLLLYRAGTRALHGMPDALSRNPRGRDGLILSRTGEWQYWRARIKEIAEEIASGTFDDEDHPVYSEAQVGEEIKEFQKAREAAEQVKQLNGG